MFNQTRITLTNVVKSCVCHTAPQSFARLRMLQTPHPMNFWLVGECLIIGLVVVVVGFCQYYY